MLGEVILDSEDVNTVGAVMEVGLSMVIVLVIRSRSRTDFFLLFFKTYFPSLDLYYTNLALPGFSVVPKLRGLVKIQSCLEKLSAHRMSDYQILFLSGLPGVQ